MSIRRRSTVHDLASLRIHPDGSRVQNPRIEEDEVDDGTLHRNLKLRRAHYIERDANGNWIAKDAGGKGSVKEIRAGTKRINATSSGEEFRLDSERHSDGKGEEPEQKEGCVLKDIRAKKRRMFYEDHSFLDDSSSSAGPSRSVSVSIPPVPLGAHRVESEAPSSDFLKCIHYYASNYYHEEGILYDAGKEARAKKKARKLQHMQDRVDDDAEESKSSSFPAYLENNTSSEYEHSDEAGNDSDNEKNEAPARKNAPGKKSRRSEKLRKDMYKAFDGSALMALGILMQEHLDEMLDQNPSSEWLQEVAGLSTTNDDGEETIVQRKRRARRRKVNDTNEVP